REARKLRTEWQSRDVREWSGLFRVAASATWAAGGGQQNARSADEFLLSAKPVLAHRCDRYGLQLDRSSDPVTCSGSESDSCDRRGLHTPGSAVAMADGGCAGGRRQSWADLVVGPPIFFGIPAGLQKTGATTLEGGCAKESVVVLGT